MTYNTKAIPITEPLPENHVIPNNKLSNVVFSKTVVNIGEFDFITLRAKHKIIKNAGMLTFDGNECGKIQLTEYDRQVHDAVVSLFADGIDVITSATVYRTMCGSNMGDVSKQQLEAVSASLSKMSSIIIQADISPEIEDRKISVNKIRKTIEIGCDGTYILNMRQTALEYKSKDGIRTINAWKLKEIPFLYAYSQITNQVLTIPTKLLDISAPNGKTLNNNDQRIAIRGYLARRVLVMRGNRKMSNRILIENIYNLFEPTDDRKKLQRYKEYILSVLDFWKSVNFISDYGVITKNNKHYAVDIIV